MAIESASFHCASGLLCLAIAVGTTGCGQSDDIRSYTVPRPAGRAERILAAIVPGRDQTWFFKAADAPEKIEPHADAFRQLIQSIRFVGTEPARPEWTLPAGWRQQEGSGMRFATIQFGGDEDPLELTVIPLPTPDGDSESYTMSNINRWREQIGLAPITADALDAESEQISLDSKTARIVDMVGERRGGMGRPRSTVPQADSPGAVSQRPERGALSLRYDTPEGWQPAPAGGMRQAAFRITGGKQQAELTAIVLGPEAAALLPNVNRWRRQINLQPITQQAMEQDLLKPVDVDGRPGHFLYLVGPEEATRRQAILGVIVVDEARTWFFKMRGDAALVGRQQENFQAFIASVEFVTPDERS